MKSILCAVLFFGCSYYGYAESKNQFDAEILDLQKKFGKASKLYPILYVDKSYFDKNLVQDIEKDPDNLATIKEFVLQRTGLKIDDQTADTVYDYYSTQGTFAQIIDFAAAGQKICLIMPPDPNLSHKERADRLLAWDILKGTPEYHGKTANLLLSEKELRLISLYHETFHCLDEHYLPKRKPHSYLDTEEVHKVELFAELGALMFLSQIGYDNLAISRSVYRLVGSYMVGHHKDLIGPSMDDVYWGAVYSFYNPLLELQDYIDSSKGKLSLQGVLQKTYSMTEELALDDVELFTIDFYQTDPDKQQSLIDEILAPNSTHSKYIIDRFKKVKAYREVYSKALDWAFAELFD